MAANKIVEQKMFKCYFVRAGSPGCIACFAAIRSKDQRKAFLDRNLRYALIKGKENFREHFLAAAELAALCSNTRVLARRLPGPVSDVDSQALIGRA
jgi:hypothetical protein